MSPHDAFASQFVAPALQQHHGAGGAVTITPPHGEPVECDAIVGPVQWAREEIDQGSREQREKVEEVEVTLFGVDAFDSQSAFAIAGLGDNLWHADELLEQTPVLTRLRHRRTQTLAKTRAGRNPR